VTDRSPALGAVIEELISGTFTIPSSTRTIGSKPTRPTQSPAPTDARLKRDHTARVICGGSDALMQTCRGLLASRRQLATRQFAERVDPQSHGRCGLV